MAAKGTKKYGSSGGCSRDLLKGLCLPDEVADSLANLGNLGVAKSTWNAYKTAQQMLLKCAKDSQVTMDIPLTNRQILIFIDWLARVRGLKSSTINSYLSGIRQLHVVQGIDPPLIRSGIVNLVLKGITNRDGIASRSNHLTGRLPMTTNVMLLFQRLITTLPYSVTDKALIWAASTLAFAGAFRIGELLCKNETFFDPDFDLLDKDVSITSDKTGAKTIHVTLKSPKEAKTKLATIVDVFQNFGPLCPVAAFDKWGKTPAIAGNSPVFVFQDGTLLTGNRLNKILDTTLGRYTDKKIGKFTTHSFRIGLASELGRLGFTDDEIKEAGRWSSRAFEAYLRLKRTKRAAVAKQIAKVKVNSMGKANKF